MLGFRHFPTSEHTGHRFGFNGMEKDDEVYNSIGTSYDFGARIYSSRLGRWNSVDPLAHDARQVGKSPYASMWNNPVIYKDPDGKIPLPVITGLIGFTVGGVVEIGSQVASNRAQGVGFTEALQKVDWFDVGVSMVEGAALGSGMGVMGKTLLTPTSALLKSSVDYSGGELQYIGGDDRQEKKLDQFGIDLASNMVGGTVSKFGLSDAVSKKVIRGLSEESVGQGAVFTKLMIGQLAGDGTEGMINAGVEAGLKNAKNMGVKDMGVASDEPVLNVMLPEVQVSASAGEAKSNGQITSKGEKKVNRHIEKHSQ